MNININIILENRELDWDFNLFNYNSNITWNDIKNNPNFEWNFENISNKKCITF